MHIKYKKWAILVVVFSSFSAYAESSHLPSPVRYNMIVHTAQFAAINTIVANGYFDLELSRHRSTTTAVKTVSYEAMPITVKVHDHTLFVTSSPKMYLNYAKHPVVQVQLSELNKLKVSGPTNVIASNVASQHGLKLKIHGYGAIKMRQAGNVRCLKQKGNSVVSIMGIKSAKLTVKLLGFGHTTLQGTVNNLYARLNGDAILQARQLAAQHVVIQAKYNSAAYVYPLRSLRAFADQSAAIFYYKHLNDLTGYPVASGNVLQMQW